MPLGTLFEQLPGLAHGEVGALAGLGHDRWFDGFQQVARGGQVVGQRHQGMCAAGVDDDGRLGVAARLQQVEQLAAHLFHAAGSEVGGEHFRRQFDDHHQRIVALHGRLFDALPARPEQGEHRQQPGEAEVDPWTAIGALFAAAEQPGMEGLGQQQLPAAGAAPAMQEFPHQPGEQRQRQQPPRPQQVGQQLAHGRLHGSRGDQRQSSGGHSSRTTSSTLSSSAPASGQAYRASAGRAWVGFCTTGSS
ncbi:hypothetical protein D3C81_1455070 [compost metagenome]